MMNEDFHSPEIAHVKEARAQSVFETNDLHPNSTNVPDIFSWWCGITKRRIKKKVSTGQLSPKSNLC